MELFTERGFDQTTAGDIAELAGVTERTFFRHFTDKREVLFDGTHTMERIARDATVAAPPGLAPLDVALTGVTAGASILDDRHDHSVRRSMIIASHPSLRERELLKLAAHPLGLSGTTAAHLRLYRRRCRCTPRAHHTVLSAASSEAIVAPMTRPTARS